MNQSGATISELDAATADALAQAFSANGWNKPREQYSKYLRLHEDGKITCLVARVEEQVAGYLKIVWSPGYTPLREAGIPEIQDLNVLDEFRNRGVASALLDKAEYLISERSPVVGIGVGMHPGYGAAQRLYVKRGYVPDGRGLTYNDEVVQKGETVRLDDDLVLRFTKNLRDD